MARRRGAGALTEPAPKAAPAAPPTVAAKAAPTSAAPLDRRDSPAAATAPPWSWVCLPLALLLTGLAVVVGALVVGPPNSPVTETEPGRRAALEAARERTSALTAYDYRRLDADFAGVLATATGQFAEDYRSTSEQLRQAFTMEQAVATVKVVGAGLEAYAPERAVAIVALDQVIATKDAPPRTERNRIRMTLVQPADTWLVERVELL